MKKIIYLSIMLIAMQVAKAQTNTVTGNVSDEKGNPISAVFILQGQTTNATFTDSVGNFSIKVNAGGVLKFDAPGYADNITPVDQVNTNSKITLKPLGAAGAAGDLKANTSVTGQQSINAISNSDLTNLANGGTMTGPGHKKGNVHGSQYIFDDFVHGFIVNPSDELVYDPAYRFDYDKIGGILLLSKDNNHITQVGDGQIKSFSLFNSSGQRFTFEKIAAISDKYYVQVLAEGKKYKIAKLTTTTFAKSDYVNNGFSAHGNDYDEFVDAGVYYLLNVQTNQAVKFTLRKKSIKEVFAADADKANKYMSDNSGDIDDAYLSNLGDFMNQ